MKAFCLFLLTVCMLACTCCSVPEDRGTPKPDTLLAMSEMQEMMTEVCQLEARLRVYENGNGTQRDSLSAYGRQQLDTMLQRHGIGWETWKANFNYYMTRKVLADTLLTGVTGKLSAEEAAKGEALRQTMDTTMELLIPSDAEWGEVILF